MKRYLALLLSLICVLSVALSGCGVDPSLQSGKKEPTVTTDDPVLDDQPEGTEELDERIVPYREAKKASKSLYVSENHTAVDVAAVRRNWSNQAIQNYRKALELAKKGL